MTNQAPARIDTLKRALINNRKQIESLLQDTQKANRFLAASLVVASNDNLKNCAPESIAQALIGVAMSDLNIDGNIGHCYLVPYKTTCQLQIGYKGYIQLLYRAGWLVKSFPVFSVDEFSIDFDGWDNRVHFVPNLDDRQEGDNDWVFQNLRGVYVVARNADTKDEYSLFVNKSVIEKLRQTSPNQKLTDWIKGDDRKRLQNGEPIGVWKDWYIEMAQAKAIKKLAKSLPIGDMRLNTALSVDDKTESGKIIDYKKTAETGVVIEAETIIEKATDYTSEREAFKAKPEIKSLETDWQTQISQCQTGTQLTELLKTMPEIIQLEYQEEIDTQYDLMK